MKLLVIIPFLLISMSPAFAQSSIKDAGITPDSPLYFLDLLGDDIALALTSTANERALLSLEIAEERLSEFEEMSKKGDAKSITKARVQHEERLQEVELIVQQNTQRIQQLGSVDELDDELEDNARIMEGLEKHKQNVETTRANVVEILESNLNRLSENENANIEQALVGLETAIQRIQQTSDENQEDIEMELEDRGVSSIDVENRVENARSMASVDISSKIPVRP